ncbi:MAG: hypothetical protein ACYC9Y_10335 [Candidatus Methylomirabilia bacterium]
MEEEARQILRRSLARERSSVGLGSRIAHRFSADCSKDLNLTVGIVRNVELALEVAEVQTRTFSHK